MFSSKNEETMIKKLIQINKKNPNELITFVMQNGAKISGVVNLFYETDNGLAMEEKDYQEYYACVVESKNGSLTEIGGSNLPKFILLDNGEILWSRNNDL